MNSGPTRRRLSPQVRSGTPAGKNETTPGTSGQKSVTRWQAIPQVLEGRPTTNHHRKRTFHTKQLSDAGMRGSVPSGRANSEDFSPLLSTPDSEGSSARNGADKERHLKNRIVRIVRMYSWGRTQFIAASTQTPSNEGSGGALTQLSALLVVPAPEPVKLGTVCKLFSLDASVGDDSSADVRPRTPHHRNRLRCDLSGPLVRS